MIAYMQSFGNEKQRGGVALDGDHGEMQSATLGLEIESVDQDLSQVGGVDPWNSAAVIS